MKSKWSGLIRDCPFKTFWIQIVYTGEFTYTLKSRWLSKRYVAHYIYVKLAEALREDTELAMWVAVSPYVDIPDMGELNISKSPEQNDQTTLSQAGIKETSIRLIKRFG